MYITNKRPHISRYLRNDAALSEKLPNLAAPHGLCRPLVQTSYAQKLQFIGHIFVADS